MCNVSCVVYDVLQCVTCPVLCKMSCSVLYEGIGWELDSNDYLVEDIVLTVLVGGGGGGGFMDDFPSLSCL